MPPPLNPFASEYLMEELVGVYVWKLIQDLNGNNLQSKLWKKP